MQLENGKKFGSIKFINVVCSMAVDGAGRGGVRYGLGGRGVSQGQAAYQLEVFFVVVVIRTGELETEEGILID